MNIGLDFEMIQKWNSVNEKISEFESLLKKGTTTILSKYKI